MAATRKNKGNGLCDVTFYVALQGKSLGGGTVTTLGPVTDLSLPEGGTSAVPLLAKLNGTKTDAWVGRLGFMRVLAIMPDRCPI